MVDFLLSTHLHPAMGQAKCKGGFTRVHSNLKPTGAPLKAEISGRHSNPSSARKLAFRVAVAQPRGTSMPTWRYSKPVLRILGILLVLYTVICAAIYIWQRSMLFFPTHAALSTRLSPWSDGNCTKGYCREVPNARTIWLMMHGNAGQSADREYVLRCMVGQDSLYVLEYPGYGRRKGSPSLKSMNRAASEAYRLLRLRNPNTPVCILGESIGSGPACALARERIAPDKIVLVVPFDSLVHVASRHFPFLPVRLLLRDAWDNVDSLKGHAGPVEIFGARDDAIIPIEYARALAKQIPGARFVELPGGHNDWSDVAQVKIQR